MTLRTVAVHVSAAQHDWLAAVAKGRHAIAREGAITGRIPKASPAAVVVGLISVAMGEGSPSLPSSEAVLAALAAPPELIEPTILSIGPGMLRDVPTEELAWAVERLHELLAAVYGRVRRERLFIPAAVETPRRIASR